MRKKELTIHIGTSKTGTTAIQRFFATNRQQLSSLGICYPYAGNINTEINFGHHFLSHCFFKNSLTINVKDTSPDKEWNSLVNEINTSQSDRFLISSEDFYLLGPDSISYIKSFLLEFDVKIIMTVRPQTEWILSNYNQVIRDANFMGTLNEYFNLTNRRGLFFLDRRIQSWSKFFDLSIYLYRMGTEPSTLIVDFLQAIGNIDSSIFEFPTRLTNVSLNGLGLAALRYITLQDAFTPSEKQVARSAITRLCSDNGVSMNNLAPLNFEKIVCEAYVDSNRCVLEKLCSRDCDEFVRRQTHLRRTNRRNVEAYIVKLMNTINNQKDINHEIPPAIASWFESAMDELYFEE